MVIWFIFFGFVVGFIFSLIIGLNIFVWVGEFGNYFIGGILGSIFGVMGGIFVGGGVGVMFGSGDVLFYCNCLKVGKYLIVVKGLEFLICIVICILYKFKLENI